MAGNLTAMIAAAFSGGAAPPVTSDPYFEYTTLLLPGNGTNGAQNNTFLDGSTNNFTITRNGNTTQGTFSPFSQTGWGNYFSGSSQYLTVPNGTFVLGSNNFVIESFIYATDITSAARSIVVGQTDAATAGGSSWDFTINQTTGTLKGVLWIGGSATVITSTNAVPLNQWVHVAFVRTGGTGSLFINGTKDGTNTGLGTSSVQTGSTTYAPSIGRNGTGSFFSGYISNCRVVIGAGASSVYNATSSSITVPTSPLTAVTNTVVLTCQSNRFVDNSSSPVTVTPSGSPTVVAFSPFNPSASWSAATYGGSGYFDGTGDYLNLGGQSAFAFGTGDFTLEGWFYFNALGNSIYDARPSGTFGGNYLAVGVLSNGQVEVLINTVQISAGAVTINQWTHIAITRSGTDLRLFVNGTQAGSTVTNITNLINGASRPTIGVNGANTGVAYVNGYIGSYRVVTGTAVYTANFTPPTAPLTATQSANTNGNPSAAITGSATSLLLNYTNAGIFDATSKNDLETVGNAQISTTQSKWGGSSMAFDGTGDWLLSTPSVINDFGTGNFTIEAWIYMTSTSNYFYIYNSSNANFNSPNFTFLYDTSLGLRMYAHGGTYTVNQGSTSGWAANTWYYVALVRNGGTITIYRNGTSLASGSTFSGVSFGSATAPLQIGGSSPDSRSNNGYIQDLRVSRYARDVTTTPTAAFPTL